MDATLALCISFFPSIPLASNSVSRFQTALTWKFELLKRISPALDIFDIVSNLYSVPVSSGLDAVVYSDTPHHC